MPAEYERGIPGPVNTDMGQAPGFNQTLGRELATPGRDERPRTQRIDQLRSVLMTAGEAISGAVNSEARVRIIAQNRREERIAASRRLAAEVAAKKEDELDGQHRQYKHNMNSRLKGIENDKFNILRDARSTNPEWVMNQAVLRQENAGTDEERGAWNDFIIHYQGASRQDAAQESERVARQANRKLADDTAFAAKTASQSIDILTQDINGNPDLEKQLIGDGRGITERVFDYAYQVAVASAPDLFDLKKNDPMYAEKKRAGDELLLEMETRALHSIVKPLVAKAGKNQESASEVAGWDLIESQQLSYSEGKQTPEEFHDSVGDIIRVKFAHLDPEQRETLRSKMYTNQFNRLVTMLDSDDPGQSLERMEGLLRVSDLSDAEKNSIRTNIISDKFPNAVATKLSQQFASMENSIRTVSVGPNGKPAAADPRVAVLDMLKNPEGQPGGPSRYMDLGAQMLDKLGVRPGIELSPLQANLQMSVMAEVEKAEHNARQLQDSIDRKVEVGVKLRSGAALTVEDSTKAWNGGWSMSAMSGDLTMDDNVYQSLSVEYRQRFGKDIPWDGKGPLVLNQETEQVGVMLAREDAEAWRSNLSTPFPSAMSDRVSAFVRSGNPAQVKWALNFYQALGPTGQERLGKSLGTGRESVWLNAALQEGSRLMFSPRATEQGQDMTSVVNQMRQITESMANEANTRALYDAGVRWEKDQKYNTEAGKSLERALGAGPDAGGFGVEGDEGDTPEDRIMDLIGQDKENLATLFQRAYMIQSLNPGTSVDTAMSTVVAEMRSQGYTVSDSDRGKVLIRDPFNHTAYDPKRDQAVSSNFNLWRDFPMERKYDQGMKGIMSQSITDRALKEYGAAIGATDEDVQFARERGSRKDWLMFSMLQREAATQGVDGIPLPEEWAWRAAPMSGPEFDREMGAPDGGVPMLLEMPGFKPMNQMHHRGRAIHTFSATRLSSMEGSLVSRDRVVDNRLTTPAQAVTRVPAKLDSAARMASLMEFADKQANKKAPFGALDMNN